MPKLNISGNFPTSVSIFKDRRLFFQRFKENEVHDHKQFWFLLQRSGNSKGFCLFSVGWGKKKKGEILDFLTTEKF